MESQAKLESYLLTKNWRGDRPYIGLTHPRYFKVMWFRMKALQVAILRKIPRLFYRVTSF